MDFYVDFSRVRSKPHRGLFLDMLDQDHPQFLCTPTTPWDDHRSLLSDFQIYNGSKLDGLDRSPLSECLICYCRVCRYSAIFAVRDVFFVGVMIHFQKDIRGNLILLHRLFMQRKYDKYTILVPLCFFRGMP